MWLELGATPNKSPIINLWDWIVKRLERTVFLGMKFTFPQKFLSPMGYSGMLTFAVFMVLGVTGAVLMLFYVPTIDGAWNSVNYIDHEIPYGFAIRNIHYHASNAMVFLAVLHLYYQYFSGRYKIRNEIIWVTGVVLGVVTILEAFSGYDLIFNDRAELAISIGVGLTVASPVIGPQLTQFIWGQGFSDFILRLYALHVFVIPLIMVALMFVHFPRFLVFDIPMISAIIGIVAITGGIFPIEMGARFDPSHPPGITVPEWYLTGLYAFLRSGFDRFVTGGLLPALLIVMFIVVPFIDNSRKFSWKDRPFFTAVGLTSIAQAFVTTIWGFYVNPDPSLTTVKRLFIEPVPLYSIMLVCTVFCFALTYGFLKARSTFGSKTKTFTRPSSISLNSFWSTAVIGTLILFELLLNGMALMAYNAGLRQLALFEIGLIFLGFSVIFHVYRSYDPANEAVDTNQISSDAASVEPSVSTPTVSNSTSETSDKTITKE